MLKVDRTSHKQISIDGHSSIDLPKRLFYAPVIDRSWLLLATQIRIYEQTMLESTCPTLGSSS